jgi:hypothetical protein
MDRQSIVLVREGNFPPAPLDSDASVPHDPNRSIRSILDKAAQDLHDTIHLFTPLEDDTEYTRRELISPILKAAALIVGGVVLRSEYPIKGRRGHGPVDYVAIYKQFCIVLSEAKKQESLLEAMGQVRIRFANILVTIV